MIKQINILFFFALVVFFALFAKTGDHLRIGVAVLAAISLSMGAFLLGWLSLGGAKSATVVGTIALGLGNWQMALILVTFFGSASVLSKFAAKKTGNEIKTFRRTEEQVWANGFWFSIWLLIGTLSGLNAFSIAAVTAISTATADTWASEVGRLMDKTTYLITNLDTVKPGTDGGISLPGTIAALAGASLIAFLYWLVFAKIPLILFLIIAIAGLLGCFLDSFLGALIQKHRFTITLIPKYLHSGIRVNNNNVNWLATGISSVLVLLIALIFDL